VWQERPGCAFPLFCMPLLAMLLLVLSASLTFWLIYVSIFRLLSCIQLYTLYRCQRSPRDDPQSSGEGCFLLARSA
jgi:hypothetical protein